MQMRDGEAPERKVSRYTVRPGTLGLTLVAVAASASAVRLDLPCLHHHPANLRDDLDATVRVGEHQRRCPVSRHVLEHCARGAARLQ
jgi:hypothetical protein